MGGRILITGGAGFIGGHLARRYLEKGWQVTIYDNLSRRGTRENLAWLRSLGFPSLEVIIDDIRNYPGLCQAVVGADLVCHLASQVAVTTSVLDPRTDFEVNALGTFNVLEAVRQKGNNPVVIYASTNKVYGSLEGVGLKEVGGRYAYRHFQGIPESFPLDFHSPYGCSKGAGDQYARDYSRIYGLRTIVFRQSCIYGTRQFGNEDQGWVAHFVISAVLGAPIVIYGDGQQVRDILFIDDLLDAFEMAAEGIEGTAGQVYNIGGGPQNTASLREMLDELEGMVGRKVSYSFADWRPGDQKVYVSDIGKAAQDFGWKPRTPKEEGLQKLFSWVVENREMLASGFSGKS